jgi:hypothetical protein
MATWKRGSPTCRTLPDRDGGLRWSASSELEAQRRLGMMLGHAGQIRAPLFNRRKNDFLLSSPTNIDRLTDLSPESSGHLKVRHRDQAEMRRKLRNSPARDRREALSQPAFLAHNFLLKQANDTD